VRKVSEGVRGIKLRRDSFRREDFGNRPGRSSKLEGGLEQRNLQEGKSMVRVRRRRIAEFY
jgi:hypothetical protein